MSHNPISDIEASLKKAQEYLAVSRQKIAQMKSKAGSVPNLAENDGFPPQLITMLQDIIKEYITMQQDMMTTQVNKKREELGIPIKKPKTMPSHRRRRTIMNV